jgi:hypothetical protein
LVKFYLNEASDDRGRWLRDIWEWDFDRLERTHDYIQWLFPLPEPSGVNPGAPLADAATVAAFRTDERLRRHLGRSLGMMLGFYGYRSSPSQSGPIVEETASLPTRQQVWLTPFNHNFLRITRILRSCTLLGLEAESRAFHAELARLYEAGARDVIGARTFEYWRAAVTAAR